MAVAVLVRLVKMDKVQLFAVLAVLGFGLILLALQLKEAVVAVEVGLVVLLVQVAQVVAVQVVLAQMELLELG